MCLLKSYPHLGRFPRPRDIPASIIEFLAKHAGLPVSSLEHYPKRTLLRHQIEIRHYLGVNAWSEAAAAVATQTMQRLAGGRAHFSDLINGAIEALIAARFELPALSTLRRLAGHVHAVTMNAWLAKVSERLADPMRSGLEKLLVVPEGATESAFADLCRPAKRPSRDHLDEAIEQLNRVIDLALPKDVLADVPVSRIDAWAEEARRLTATELREYVQPRRHALLICLLSQIRARRLDDLVTMLIRFIGRIEAKARGDLDAWHRKRRMNLSELVGILRELAVARRDAPDADQFAAQTDQVFVRAGGLEHVVSACEEHLANGPEDWRAYAQPHFWEQRHWLYRLVEALPLRRGPAGEGLVNAIEILQFHRERPCDEFVATFDDRFLDPEWRAGVVVPKEPHVYRFRQLETAAFFELVDALKGGDIYVEGAANYGAFTDDIFPIESQPEAVAQFLKDRGFPDSAKEYVRGLRERLQQEVIWMEHAVGTDRTVVLRPDGKPIAPRPTGIKPPLSAQQLAEAIQERMPTRTVLEALYNTDRWSGWTRHFGPPGRLSSQIEDRQRRCVLTTFAVGSGLGPTQAARHFDEPISPHLMSFVQRRHMGTGSLRAACADVLNQYAKFELPTHWGPMDKVAADGSLLTTYEDNIQASYHVRYRRTGAVAYRHVGTNYIAYFTNFIVAGAYEGAYLFDALQMNESNLKATGVYSDTHGQSAVLFAVAELFDVELLPRIRNWRSLTLYRPDMQMNLFRTGRLYGGIIDWELIESQWKEFIRVALAIQSGRVAPSWILTRLNSYSRRNKLYRAFRELGRVFRTIYLLRWITDDNLRRAVTHEANKVEHYHDFASHLNFGSQGVLRTNSRVEQEKAMIANQLVANAVISQTVADQTRVIQQLKSEGYPFQLSDVKHLSPYLTRHLLRFGKFSVRCKSEPLPDNLSLNP